MSTKRQQSSACPHCAGDTSINEGVCTKHLKELTQAWYKKAADDGFKDVEQLDGKLKIWHATYFRTVYSPRVFSAKETYYRKADQFSHRHTFDSDFERMIWLMHASGMSLSESEKALAAIPHMKAQRETIRKVVVSIREKMLKTKW